MLQRQSGWRIAAELFTVYRSIPSASGLFIFCQNLFVGSVLFDFCQTIIDHLKQLLILTLCDGNADISTGIGFFDHMLEGFARHGNFDLKIIEKGDLNVDCHHTVEDLGIVLGQAIAKLTEDKTGLNRYASFIQPMDDALVLVSVDLCSRAYLNFNYEFTKERVGYFETETLKEFFRAVADQAGMNIHIKVLDGENTHHIIEATFKGFANALNIATSKDGRKGVLSTKGTL